MRKINKIKLFIKKDPKSMKVGKLLIEKLIDKKFEITDTNYELVISIGGDET